MKVSICMLSTTVDQFYIHRALCNTRPSSSTDLSFLCSSATIVEENLIVVLDSKPLTGPAILLPANQSQVTSSTLHLTCTVTNQGRFQWQWNPASHPPVVSDGTRTSTIEIPLDEGSVGEYICTASYHSDTGLAPSSVTGTFTVQLESEFKILHMC